MTSGIAPNDSETGKLPHLADFVDLVGLELGWEP
jgi:hypothetical protein